MTTAISIREFARREGCSDTLVRRAVKQGRLRLSGDNGLDASLVGTAWRESNAKAANSANKGANTIVAELANGKTIIGRNMWTIEDQTAKAADATIEVKWEGLSVKEN